MRRQIPLVLIHCLAFRLFKLYLQKQSPLLQLLHPALLAVTWWSPPTASPRLACTSPLHHLFASLIWASVYSALAELLPLHLWVSDTSSAPSSMSPTPQSHPHSYWAHILWLRCVVLPRQKPSLQRNHVSSHWIWSCDPLSGTSRSQLRTTCLSQAVSFPYIPHIYTFPCTTLRSSKPAQENTKQHMSQQCVESHYTNSDMQSQLSPFTGEQSCACSLWIPLLLVLEMCTENSLLLSRLMVRNLYQTRSCVQHYLYPLRLLFHARWTGCLLRWPASDFPA